MMWMSSQQCRIIGMRLGIIPIQLFAATPDLVAVTGKLRGSQIKAYNFQHPQTQVITKKQFASTVATSLA